MNPHLAPRHAAAPESDRPYREIELVAGPQCGTTLAIRLAGPEIPVLYDSGVAVYEHEGNGKAFYRRG